MTRLLKVVGRSVVTIDASEPVGGCLLESMDGSHAQRDVVQLRKAELVCHRSEKTIAIALVVGGHCFVPVRDPLGFAKTHDVRVHTRLTSRGSPL
jgi:hypothetical protein